ncbi:hypothetical protein A3B35_00940 [Candidatus Kaiserbacteria bacterium RIFCSPLOWO2_01_FULL_54_24]|uniref:Uncharacterized protein n=1 Tax=Candidatus Kaiserbacteria bacterium RIFCSPLOWO2_01_FULL_54_24 TaxID=1798515 RepID=A0A1F6ETG7_9BACT|nr:MAG: hypothetical protein A3B35_00940 [Candidatus Kaiserbacteria bacterium RIFCSPLOWO2_01_FULL_54_24]
MFERHFQSRIGVEETRQDVCDKKSLAVVRVFLFARIVEMHFAVKKERHADFFHLFQHVLCFKYRTVPPLRICRRAIGI